MKLYTRFLLIHIKAQMQYKASFFLTLLGQFFTSFTALLAVFFMFNRFNEVDGFALEEVLLTLATILLAYSLAECFARGFDLFPRMIGNGQFDRILVRPRNIIFQVLASTIEFTRLGRMFQAILVFVYAIPNSSVVWTANRVLTLILMVLCGTILFFFLFLIYASFSFFTIEGIEFMNIFTDGAREFGRYPFSIYGEEVLKILTYIIPIALIQYYPLLFLLGRETSILYMLSPVISLFFGIPAYSFWRFGLKKYKSTGS